MPVAPLPAASPSIGDKVVFLASGLAFPPAERPVTVVETHLSWLFLGRSLVLKLKKPVRLPYLDFTTLERRRRNCQAELELNRRLAPDIYRRLVPLRADPTGRLTMESSGHIVDWLVEMVRLPSREMLESRIAAGTLHPDDVRTIALRLAGFYAAARPEIRDAGAYLTHLKVESAVSREILLRPSLGLASARTESELDAVDRLLEHWTPAIEARIAAGYIVEGHGDLRPEHICLEPLCVYDCLEFDRKMRILDPYDEVNFLGLECAMLGAGWVRPLLLSTLSRELGHAPDPRLLATYGAFRGVLRARLCLAHLLDVAPREPVHWVRMARRYLGVASRWVARAAA